MEAYLEALSIPELIDMLKDYAVELEGVDLVGKELLSREYKMKKEVEDLEKRCFELSNSLEEAKKKDNVSAAKEIEDERKRHEELEKMSELVMERLKAELEDYKAKCAGLENALEEEKTKGIEAESKVAWHEGVCRVVSEREKKALENAAAVEKMNRKINVEVSELKGTLECVKQNDEDEMQEEKKRYTELQNKSKDAISKLENDLERERRKCSKLSLALEEKEKKMMELLTEVEKDLEKCNACCSDLSTRLKKFEKPDGPLNAKTTLKLS